METPIKQPHSNLKEQVNEKETALSIYIDQFKAIASSLGSKDGLEEMLHRDILALLSLVSDRATEVESSMKKW